MSQSLRASSQSLTPFTGARDLCLRCCRQALVLTSVKAVDPHVERPATLALKPLDSCRESPVVYAQGGFYETRTHCDFRYRANLSTTDLPLLHRPPPDRWLFAIVWRRPVRYRGRCCIESARPIARKRRYLEKSSLPVATNS